MADTPPITPGKDTSEFWLAKITLVLSVAAVVVGSLMDALQKVQDVPGVGQSPTLGKIMVVLGLLSGVIVTMLQMLTRVALKKKALELQASNSADDTLGKLAGNG